MDVVPALFAVLIGLALHHWLPSGGRNHHGFTLSPFERDLLALFGGALAYVALAVIAKGLRMPREMGQDYEAWPERSGETNVVLNLAVLAPDEVECCDVRCEVTPPKGKKTHAGGLVYQPPTMDLPKFYNFPGQFPGAVVQNGVHKARWYVRENHETE